MGFGEKTLETSHKDEIPLNDNVRILLAEDNSINQLVAIKILNRLGYTAETVSNGLEAVKSAEAKDYDLILMDCQMPELDGYAATEMLRKHEETSGRHTLVIAMTAHALKGDREKCLSAGMDDYLTKPIDMKALDQMLAKWLNKLKTGEVQRQKSTQHKPQPALNKAAEHSESMHASVRASSTPDQKQVEEKENLPELRSKIIDMERIHDIFGDNSETIKLFIQTFIQSTDETLTEISTTIRDKDSEQAKKLFHRLKGSAGNSGMMIMHELCISAEQVLAIPDWKMLNEIYESVLMQFQQIKTEAERIIE
jgi:CheY-like chemotaxis protein/HPt (histidine-containing phosphotransfer) domain-containing protein